MHKSTAQGMAIFFDLNDLNFLRSKKKKKVNKENFFFVHIVIYDYVNKDRKQLSFKIN